MGILPPRRSHPEPNLVQLLKGMCRLQAAQVVHEVGGSPCLDTIWCGCDFRDGREQKATLHGLHVVGLGCPTWLY